MNTDLMFSSETDLWSTPQDLFDKLNNCFKFTLDVCALPENAKVDNYFSPESNALIQEWIGVCWMNPPYGREISKWIFKAYTESRKHNSTVICLLPARVDTKWWHDYCTKGEVFFIKGRLKFGSAKNSAPFPSAIVVFRPSIRDILSTTTQAH